MNSPQELIEAFATNPRLPLLLVWGPDNIRLTVALTRHLASLGTMERGLEKRNFYRGRAHPSFLECLKVKIGERDFIWHQTTQHFTLHNESFLESGSKRLPSDTSLWTAFKEGSLLILTAASLTDMDRRVLRTAFFFGLKRVVLAGKPETATENFLREIGWKVEGRVMDQAEFWPALTQSLAALDFPAKAPDTSPALFLATQCKSPGLLMGVNVRGDLQPGNQLTVFHWRGEFLLKILKVMGAGYLFSWQKAVQEPPEWDHNIVVAAAGANAASEDVKALRQLAENGGFF